MWRWGPKLTALCWLPAGAGAGAELPVRAPGCGFGTNPHLSLPGPELGAVPTVRAQQRPRGLSAVPLPFCRVLQVTFQENWKL